MKKINNAVLLFLTLIFLFCTIFASCTKSSKNAKSSTKIENITEKTKIKIIAETFPIYDWIKNIVGDYCDVELLINSGTELHSWQPTLKDVLNLTGNDTDLFVHIGGESDFWVKKIIPEMQKNGVEHFSIMEENVSLLEPMGEHTHEGHEGAHHEHEHDEDEKTSEDDDFDADEYDEHIWLSLKRVPFFVMSVANKIAELDKENASLYLDNAKNYCQKLNQLYEDAVKVVENSTSKIIVIADRNPFNYLICDLSLESYAAFSGCTTEAEASFDVILKMQKIVEEKNILTIVCSDVESRLSKTIVDSARPRQVNVKILNSMQTKIPETENYYSVMKWNVEQLKLILNN